MIIKSNDLFERVEKRGKLMFRKSGKGQAALEFLMTYGWAILVVLIVIGALSYFGVLNPTIMLPEKCTLQMGLYCKNHLMQLTTRPSGGENHTVFFEFENGMGKGIIITGINVTGDFLNCGIRNDAAPGPPWNDNYNGKAGTHIQQGKSKIIVIDNAADGAPFRNCTIVPRFGKTKADI